MVRETAFGASPAKKHGKLERLITQAPVRIDLVEFREALQEAKDANADADLLRHAQARLQYAERAQRQNQQREAERVLVSLSQPSLLNIDRAALQEALAVATKVEVKEAVLKHSASRLEDAINTVARLETCLSALNLEREAVDATVDEVHVTSLRKAIQASKEAGASSGALALAEASLKHAGHMLEVRKAASAGLMAQLVPPPALDTEALQAAIAEGEKVGVSLEELAAGQAALGRAVERDMAAGKMASLLIPPPTEVDVEALWLAWVEAVALGVSAEAMRDAQQKMRESKRAQVGT